MELVKAQWRYHGGQRGAYAPPQTARGGGGGGAAGLAHDRSGGGRVIYTATASEQHTVRRLLRSPPPNPLLLHVHAYVKAGINRPVFTKEGYLSVESWFFTHSYVAMTHENLLCKRLTKSPQAAQTLRSEKNR